MIIIDDAQHMINDRGLQFVEAFKQITEASGAKFIFVSTEDLTPSMPVHIVRRSRSLELETA